MLIADWLQTPTFLLAIIALFVSVGGFIALRHGYARQAGEIQDRVIAAYQQEALVLERKIDNLEKENRRQNSVFLTIQYALKQYDLKITIEGDFVTLSEGSGKPSKIIHIADRIDDEAV